MAPSEQPKTMTEQPVLPTQHLETGSKQLTEASIHLVANQPHECRSYILFFFPLFPNELRRESLFSVKILWKKEIESDSACLLLVAQ